MKNKIALELFAGSRSFSNVAKRYGYDVLSVDKFIGGNGNYVLDIGDLTREFIVKSVGVPSVIWASPVCTVWSKLSFRYHWDLNYYRVYGDFKPTSTLAFESIKMISDTIKIFSWFPNAVIFMENPEGLLFKHPVINGLHQLYPELRRLTVTYCSYGFDYRKPTHIWTNSKTFIPRPVCGYSNDCHKPSPRGSSGGLISVDGSFNRSKVPSELMENIIMSL